LSLLDTEIRVAGKMLLPDLGKLGAIHTKIFSYITWFASVCRLLVMANEYEPRILSVDSLGIYFCPNPFNTSLAWHHRSGLIPLS